MESINSFQLTAIISNELRDHGYFPWIQERKTKSSVTDEEMYDTFLNPATSPYFNLGMRNGGKTVLQANASLVNIMFYALYCGYLFAYIREDEKYDSWSFKYLHDKIRGHIYEPIFISLLPQILDYTLPDVLMELYSKDSVKVFNIIYRWIYSFVQTYKLDKGILYEEYDKSDQFYKNEIPKCLKELHLLGTSLFYAMKSDRENRLYGKNLLSSNLITNLNSL